eukprot:TRINITY_DN1825_c0_g1_i1.p1 TRINITY_DN1825_c0_g1~~TRINITY_DN1825_c0_g1_i1.p1  ORF type:complete len:404 (-),score=171.16 TRINITY_DN1825_c0_g1_i1:136-1347(-)
MAEEFDNVDNYLNKLPEDEAAKVRQWMYGPPCGTLEVPADVKAMADEKDFEVKMHKFDAKPEELNAARIVRVAVIQNAIVKPTTAPLKEQYEAIRDRVSEMIVAAAKCGTNVCCLQEAWTMPFAFCTREKHPWTQFAEDAVNGPTTLHLAKLAKKYNMVIISSILERDSEHGETLWNTAVVIGNKGNYIGKHRKNHIPRVGLFCESNYYLEGNTGHPVFDTDFGKIGINICYGRHHPLNWMGFGLNGAEMVFNPSATVGSLSEPLWPIEARNAAIANSYFSFAINRVGTEHFPTEFTDGSGAKAQSHFGHFYGSSYAASPSGNRTPGLSRTRDGVLVTEMDLNLCNQVKDNWTFRMTSRYNMYQELLTNYNHLDYKPQVIVDTKRNTTDQGDDTPACKKPRHL